jgi:hypothetical protein
MNALLVRVHYKLSGEFNFGSYIDPTELLLYMKTKFKFIYVTEMDYSTKIETSHKI